MNNKEAIRRLQEYNAWRRGANAPQPNPTELGKTIDWVIVKLKLIQFEKEREIDKFSDMQKNKQK